MGLLGLLVAFGLLPGVLLVVWGWSGKRVGDHPHCARCRFDLYGVYPGADACPECGQKLWHPGAVVDGQPVRRRRPLVAGALLVAVSGLWLVLLTVRGGAVPVVYTWLPNPVLIKILGTPEARDVVVQRLRSGRLVTAQAASAIDRALDVQGDPTRFWDPSWSAIVEEGWAAGQASPAQLERFARHVLEPRLDATDFLPRGDGPWPNLRVWDLSRRGLASRVAVSANVLGATLDGRTVSGLEIPSRLGWEVTPAGLSSGVSGFVLVVPGWAEAESERDLVVVAEYVYTLELPGRSVAPHRFSVGPVTHAWRFGAVEASVPDLR